jgi:hypothetical protein
VWNVAFNDLHEGMTKLTSLILHQIATKYDTQRNTHVILLLVMVRNHSAGRRCSTLRSAFFASANGPAAST